MNFKGGKKKSQKKLTHMRLIFRWFNNAIFCKIEMEMHFLQLSHEQQMETLPKKKRALFKKIEKHHSV